MCTTLKYIHRVELPSGEDKIRTFKEKVYWIAVGDNVPSMLELDEDDCDEQRMQPCAVRETLDAYKIKLVPLNQEDHYHKLLFYDLVSILDAIGSDTPSGEWFFRFGYLAD